MSKRLSDQLDENELQQLAGALPRIAILIGGADNDFDQHEKEWAAKLVNIRSFSSRPELEELYEMAKTQFSDHVERLFQTYPKNLEDRNNQLIMELTQINHLLQKMEPEYAYLVYKSLRSYAWQIAKASGGFLGFGSINKEEAHWMELPMLTAPPAVDLEEE